MRRDGRFAQHEHSIHRMHCCRSADCFASSAGIECALASSAHRQRGRSVPQRTQPQAQQLAFYMKLAIVLPLLVAGCNSDSLPSAQARQVSGEQTQQISAQRQTAITAAVARVAPAVVTVQTQVVEAVPADFYEQFFGGRSGRRTSAGLGSGFIVRPDGVIVTNAHVVSGATRISVALRDGTTYQARLLGADETNDLAVIK